MREQMKMGDKVMRVSLMVFSAVGALLVGCASVQEVIDQIPQTDSPPAQLATDEGVLLQGRLNGTGETPEHRLVVPEGERFNFVVNTGYPGGSGTLLIDLLEVDPVDPDDPEKWRRLGNPNFTRVEMGAAKLVSSRARMRSERGEYVLRLRNVRAEGRYSIVVKEYEPTRVRGLSIEGELGDTLNLQPEYLVSIPQAERFDFVVNTAYPGGSGTLLIDLLEVDPVDPDDPEKWRRLGNPNFTRASMGAAEPVISRVRVRSERGEYVVRLRNVGAEGKYSIQFRTK